MTLLPFSARSPTVGKEVNVGLKDLTSLSYLYSNASSKSSPPSSLYALSSTKSCTGHLLGAAGAIEAIFSILAIRDQVAPPTINLDTPAVKTDVFLAPHVKQSRDIKVALSNSFGFGGTNASLLFGQID